MKVEYRDTNIKNRINAYIDRAESRDKKIRRITLTKEEYLDFISESNLYYPSGKYSSLTIYRGVYIKEDE